VAKSEALFLERERERERKEDYRDTNLIAQN
jgi:hypothetical protein